jgi:hypothetical protein
MEETEGEGERLIRQEREREREACRILKRER